MPIKSPEPQDLLHRVCVLLVEDDPVTANATRVVIEELGYSVEWAADGREALEAVSTRTFDVILLDLIMPLVDGFQVLEHFRLEHPGLLRRVIVTTGIADKYLQIVDQSTIGGILRKPLDARKLEQLVLDCIRPEQVPFEPGGECP
jgi:CheY-like chemotaxis protein